MCSPYSLQGLAALGHLRDFISASSAALQDLVTPAGFGKVFKRHADDPALRVLMEAAKSGDKAAVMRLQQAVVDKELGGRELSMHAFPVCVCECP
jgi:hypothetical protein